MCNITLYFRNIALWVNTGGKGILILPILMLESIKSQGGNNEKIKSICINAQPCNGCIFSCMRRRRIKRW